MKIEYLNPSELGLADDARPVRSWPRPRRQRRPFDNDYVDFVRAAGPGVAVGIGYRTTAPGKGSGFPLVPSPLHFAMALRTND
jgi:hypothetical protein